MSTATSNADDNPQIDEFINFKCDHVDSINDINLLPLTPELPNCYMYTVIYSLSNLNNFVKYLIKLNKKQFNYLYESTNNNDNNSSDVLVTNKREYVVYWINECLKYLLNLNITDEKINEFNEKYLSNFNLYNLFFCLREFCPMAEEDANAFLEFIIENLNEVYRLNIGDNQQQQQQLDVNQLFKTKWNVNYKCKNCLNLTKAPDDVWSIWRISIENLNQDENIIEAFFKPQILKPYNCETCKSNNNIVESEAEAISTIADNKLPLCLIIQIERMQFKDNQLIKSNNYVKFDDYVHINEYNYKLKAIILHLGDGFIEGHYICMIKKQLNTKTTLAGNASSEEIDTNSMWFILDGDKYECIPDINNEFFHKNAILLFYSQI